MHIRLVHAISSFAKGASPGELAILPHEFMSSIVTLPIHILGGEGTTLPTCAKVFAENAINQASESFVASRSELSTTGYSRESIPPQDTSTALVLPEMVEGNPKCELVHDSTRHVEWSQCQAKLEFVTMITGIRPYARYQRSGSRAIHRSNVAR